MAGHRPAGPDEHHRTEQPQGHADGRAVGGHTKYPEPRLLGGDWVILGEQGIAPLPAEHRSQQGQTDEAAHDECDEQVAQEDGKIARRQILEF